MSKKKARTPPKNQKVMPEQRREVVRRYVEDYESVADLAEEYGVSTMTIRRILCETENADKIKALKEARLAQAQLRILEQVPIALDRNEEILETDYDPAFQYLWQNAIRDTLDRAGIKAPKEEERDINITFTGGGFDVNMPEDEDE